MSPNGTLQTYRLLYNGAKDLDAYRANLVQREFAPASLDRYLRTVRQFFAWLENHQQIFINSAAGHDIPRVA